MSVVMRAGDSLPRVLVIQTRMDHDDVLPVRYARPRLFDFTKGVNEVIDLTEEDENGNTGDMRRSYARGDGFCTNQMAAPSLFGSPAAMCRTQIMRQSVYTSRRRQRNLQHVHVPPLSSHSNLDRSQIGHSTAHAVPNVIDLTEDDANEHVPSTKSRKRCHAGGLENVKPVEANGTRKKLARVVSRVQFSEPDTPTPDIVAVPVKAQGAQHDELALKNTERTTTTSIRRAPSGKISPGSEKLGRRSLLMFDCLPGSRKQTSSLVGTRRSRSDGLRATTYTDNRESSDSDADVDSDGREESRNRAASTGACTSKDALDASITMLELKDACEHEQLRASPSHACVVNAGSRNEKTRTKSTSKSLGVKVASKSWKAEFDKRKTAAVALKRLSTKAQSTTTARSLQPYCPKLDTDTPKSPPPSVGLNCSRLYDSDQLRESCPGSILREGCIKRYARLEDILEVYDAKKQEEMNKDASIMKRNTKCEKQQLQQRQKKPLIPTQNTINANTARNCGSLPPPPPPAPPPLPPPRRNPMSDRKPRASTSQQSKDAWRRSVMRITNSKNEVAPASPSDRDDSSDSNNSGRMHKWETNVYGPVKPIDLGFSYTTHRIMHPLWCAPFCRHSAQDEHVVKVRELSLQLNQAIRRFESPVRPRFRLSVFWTGGARGWGVRSEVLIKKHSLVTEYNGEILPISEVERREEKRAGSDTSFCIYMACEQVTRTVREKIDWDDAEARMTKLRAGGRLAKLSTLVENADARPEWTSKVRVEKKQISHAIDPLNFGNVARMINHCCVPNCKTYPQQHEAKLLELFPEDEYYIPPRIAYYAMRDIEPGEELTVNYLPDYKDKDEQNLEGVVPCLCGAGANCRGWVF